jgi:hypothetical protein
MEIISASMCDWEIQKAGFLITEAGKLGMNVSGYGQVAVNPNSGYTYLWLEDYLFTLYMPINCELVKTDISAIWSNPENGEEEEYGLKADTTLNNLEEWCQELQAKLED